MLEELHRRNFADTTIRSYLHGVAHFSRYYFFSGATGWPQTARAICRIAREITESSCMSGVAVLCILRTAA